MVQRLSRSGLVALLLGYFHPSESTSRISEGFPHFPLTRCLFLSLTSKLSQTTSAIWVAVLTTLLCLLPTSTLMIVWMISSRCWVALKVSICLLSKTQHGGDESYLRSQRFKVVPKLEVEHPPYMDDRSVYYSEHRSLHAILFFWGGCIAEDASPKAESIHRTGQAQL
jgi:hypothetical protein